MVTRRMKQVLEEVKPIVRKAGGRVIILDAGSPKLD